ncbi:hypothetical protein Syun_019706 [Stephania yunnanensis]|uniref:Uncharacterized protein n=1 Tax=Stephania yunnanensis TaxID=152371 RepID=A0AAP0IUP9_9MAGN
MVRHDACQEDKQNKIQTEMQEVLNSHRQSVEEFEVVDVPTSYATAKMVIVVKQCTHKETSLKELCCCETGTSHLLALLEAKSL